MSAAGPPPDRATCEPEPFRAALPGAADFRRPALPGSPSADPGHPAAYPKRFRFSVLQVLPKSTKPKEVIAWETRYKKKLGCRVTGLNAN